MSCFCRKTIKPGPSGGRPSEYKKIRAEVAADEDMALASFSFWRCHSLGLPPPAAPSFRVSCSSLKLNATLTEINNSGVIACLRANSIELALEAAGAALTADISVMEVTMSTPDVFEVLQELVQNHPRKVIGVGTVLNAKDAKTAINAGAKFLMSPVIVKEIMDDVQGGEVLYIPGAMTPTEIFSAYNAGAKIVKVYPVSALGGIQYISALSKPFSHIPMVASQGIKIDSIGEYIAQGASAVVLSDAIFDKEAMGQRNFNAIHELARLAASLGVKAVERKNGACLIHQFAR